MNNQKLLGPLIGSVIAIILLVVGIIVEHRKTIYSQLGTGQVVNIIPKVICNPRTDIQVVNGSQIITTYNDCSGTCDVINTNDSKQVLRTFNVEYTTSSVIAGDTGPYGYGKTIPIYINPNNPSDFTMYSDNYTILGWVLIIFSIFLLFVLWITYFFGKEDKNKIK